MKFSQKENNVSEYERPRISVEISDELHERRKRLIPWGQEAMLIRHLLSCTLDLLEKAGSKSSLALGAILLGDITILDLIHKKEKK